MSAPQFGSDVDAMDDAEQTPPPPPPGCAPLALRAPALPPASLIAVGVRRSYLSPSHAEAESLRWKRKMEEGALGAADFRNYWRVTVPWVYSPEPNGSCLCELCDASR